MSRALIVVKYIRQLEKALDRPLVVVETGTLRATEERYVLGDGHSTFHIASALKTSPYKHLFLSIDLDTTVARSYLEEWGLGEQVTFIEGDSLQILGNLLWPVDVAYLDSANDADHILQEFVILEPKLRPGSVVVVDDVLPNSQEVVKGHKVIPYARKRYKVTLIPNQAIIEI